MDEVEVIQINLHPAVCARARVIAPVVQQIERQMAVIQPRVVPCGVR